MVKFSIYLTRHVFVMKFKRTSHGLGADPGILKRGSNLVRRWGFDLTILLVFFFFFFFFFFFRIPNESEII